MRRIVLRYSYYVHGLGEGNEKSVEKGVEKTQKSEKAVKGNAT
jgi:hypothetical protein